jgi:transposase-like protein
VLLSPFAFSVDERTMARIQRKSDGRRIFTDQFKREQIGYILRGELTISELSRKLGIARSLLQRWKRLAPEANGAPAPLMRLRPPRASELQNTQYIHDLQLLVGKQTVELELLRAELDGLRKARRLQRTSTR